MTHRVFILIQSDPLDDLAEFYGVSSTGKFKVRKCKPGGKRGGTTYIDPATVREDPRALGRRRAAFLELELEQGASP